LLCLNSCWAAVEWGGGGGGGARARGVGGGPPPPAAPPLTQGSYGLRLDLHCHCLRVEVLGFSRSGQRWPDALARLTLAVPAGASVACSGLPGL
jgi:hypothetical protein